LSSELWEKLKLPGQITEQPWPGYDERFLVEDEVEKAVTVDGKLRDRMKFPKDATDDEMREAVLRNVKVRGVVGEGQIGEVRVIIVPNTHTINIATPKRRKGTSKQSDL
jgi:leucyl-tRNA synthetase